MSMQQLLNGTPAWCAPESRAHTLTIILETFPISVLPTQGPQELPRRTGIYLMADNVWGMVQGGRLMT